MKVKNIETGKSYSDVETALKDGCISNIILATAINSAYLRRNADAAKMCEKGNFLYAWEIGVQWLAEDIKKNRSFCQFNLLPLEPTFSVGDKVEIIDKGQIYDTYSDIFDNYENLGLSLRDVAEWCYSDINPNFSEYYDVKTVITFENKDDIILYIKGRESQKGYLIDSCGVRRKEI